MHYCMTKLVTFTSDSAAFLLQKQWYLSNTTYDVSSYLSSRLLNRQIKLAIHQLLKETQANTLKCLEKELRKRSRSAWPRAFCVLLILCLCTEDIQIAADTFITHPEDGDEFKREESHKMCRGLEIFHEECAKLFHDVFATTKRLNGHGGDGPFNPLKLGHSPVVELSPPAQGLVSEIRNIVATHCTLQHATK